VWRRPSLEPISKIHLTPNYGVADLLKMLTDSSVCCAFSSARALSLNVICIFEIVFSFSELQSAEVKNYPRDSPWKLDRRFSILYIAAAISESSRIRSVFAFKQLRSRGIFSNRSLHELSVPPMAGLIIHSASTRVWTEKLSDLSDNYLSNFCINSSGTEGVTNGQTN
jgi:hypothetical protein